MPRAVRRSALARACLAAVGESCCSAEAELGRWLARCSHAGVEEEAAGSVEGRAVPNRELGEGEECPKGETQGQSGCRSVAGEATPGAELERPLSGQALPARGRRASGLGSRFRWLFRVRRPWNPSRVARLSIAQIAPGLLQRPKRAVPPGLTLLNPSPRTFFTRRAQIAP